MVAETSGGAAGAVFVHAKSAEANSLEIVTAAQLAHEFQAAAVGKADIANHQIKRLGLRGLQSGLHVGDVANFMSSAEEGGDAKTSVVVVFHEENFHSLAAGCRFVRTPKGAMGIVLAWVRQRKCKH